VSRAEVAELADARGSGPRTRKGVGVRVPSSAPIDLWIELPAHLFIIQLFPLKFWIRVRTRVRKRRDIV
jgi:hypothetical protein